MHVSTNSRGIKRKHSTLSTDEDTAKVIGKLFHGLKEVKKAAKKVKAFETRKIVKKLKASRMSPEKKGPEVPILEAELDALKRIDHDRVGELALRSKLKKENHLSSDPAMQSAISKVFGPDAAPASEGITAKLEHRLLSSKALSREIIMVISSLSTPLKPRQDKSDTEHFTVDRRTPSETGALRSVSVPDQELGDSGDSGDDTSCSGSTTSDDPLQPRTSVIPSRSSSSSDRASHSPLRSDEASKSLGANPTFLPTLLNGFIPGGSDTDWSDGEARVADSTRKNRRGQRARRAIWEKKYGKRAKHLQKRDESDATHERRTSQKHGQRSQARPHPRVGGSSTQSFRGDEAGDMTKKHISHQQRSKTVDDRPLHPSWVAKKRMQERSSAAIVPSQGKRIKFED